MRRSAFVLGASGQIGYAAVRRLAESGWSVRAGARRGIPAGRWPRELGVEPVVVDRGDDAALAAAVGDGCDVLVDCVAYTAEHGQQLLRLADRIGSVVVISSVAVYADDTGLGFDNGEERWPELPVGCTERQPTTAPSDHSYAGRKVALERTLLSAEAIPVTVLRPGAVYGRYSHYPREWYFVKRALDGRRHRILSYRGDTRFHTISATNLAELVRLAAQRPATRVLNAGDPDAPTAREIGAAISSLLGHEAEDVLVDGPPPMREVGDTPWSAVTPVVMDMAKAETELGYRPPTTYARSVETAVAWMVDAVRGQDWRDVFAYFYANQGEEAFDYVAEDEWLASRGWQ